MIYLLTKIISELLELTIKHFETISSLYL